MTHRQLFRSASTSLFVLGLGFAFLLPGLDVVSHGDPAADAPPPMPLQPGDSLVADISALIQPLKALPADERIEQVADWAVYVALFESQLDATEIRNALYDKVPLRISGLEAATNFDYGPGRRVIHEDGEVSLFYQANRDPRTATLARLADQVRMELGEIPRQAHVYGYRPSLIDGALTVWREQSVSGGELFSPEYGYVAGTVTSLAELADWVDSTDDVTHVRLLATGGVELGGRKLEESRTWGVSTEDIAVLYQAHRGIAQTQAELEKRLQAVVGPLENAWSALIDAYNANVKSFNRNNSAIFDTNAFATKLFIVRQLLGEAARQDGLDSDPMLQFQFSSIDAQKRAIDSLEGRVQARFDELVQREYARLRRAGWDFSDEPGFSLDPQWHVAGFRQDMSMLLANPMSLVRRARSIAAASSGVVDPVPFLISRARRVQLAFDGVHSFRVPRRWAAQLREAYSGASSLTGIEAEEGGLLVFHQVKSESGNASSIEAGMLNAMLGFIEARNRVQCARYDGPIEGTEIGMYLFYTDLLAKLWSMNYAGTSPTSDIVGFISYHDTGIDLEPTYWDEAWNLPSVRLWFGTRQEGYASVEGREELNFAHIGTRVYAAGSNPLRPGEETDAAEVAGRVLRWWDRHLARIADYEQAYHAQNQIMKWSVVTGWLVEKQLMKFLDEVDAKRTHRFDRWHRAQSALRFRQPIGLIPDYRRPSPNECIDILESRGAPSAGRIGVWSGGVSLGGSRSIELGTKVSTRLRLGARRAGIDYRASSPFEIVSLSKRRFTLPPASQPGRALVDISPPNPSLRLGATDFPTPSLRTRYSSQPGSKGIRLQTADGDIGRLSIRRAIRGPALEWVDGSVNTELRLLERISHEITNSSQPLTSLSKARELMPDKGMFVLETQSGAVEIIAQPQRQVLAAGVGARAPPRALRIQRAAASPSEGSIRLAGGARSPWFWELGVESVPLEATLVPRPQVQSALNQARFQVLETLPRYDGPPQLGRLFTNRAVPEGSTPISVRTGLPDMPNLKAFADGNALMIERPVGLPPRAFNDLVSRVGLDGKEVRRIVSAVELGETSVSLTEAAVVGAEPAARVVSGDLRGALDAFVRTAREGTLDQAIAGFRETVGKESIDILAQGSRTPAPRLFRNATRAGADADALVLRTVDELGANRVNEAVESIRAAARSGLEGEAIGPARQALGRAGARDFADFLAARWGGVEGLTEAAARGVSLEATGFRASTVWDAGSRPVRTLTFSERSTLAQRLRADPGLDVYVDRRLMVELDFELAPGSNLGRVARNPRFSWYELAAPELGDLRPSIVDVNGRTYTRVPLSGTGATRSGIILIRACDPSGDQQEHCPAA